jgi:hypothetical protein
MVSNENNYKQVPLPDYVRIKVTELHKLRDDSAMLAALKQAKVEEWHGYTFAQYLRVHDPSIKDIALGDM